MLETLYYTIRIGSTPTFLYFDLYIYIYSSLVLTGKHIHFKVAPYGFLKIEKEICRPQKLPMDISEKNTTEVMH